MKKVLVSMAIIAASFSAASAQTIENAQLNPIGPLQKPQQQTIAPCPPCPPCPFCSNFVGPFSNTWNWGKKDTQKKPGAPIVASRPSVNVGISGSFNTTTNNYYNNYYPQVPVQPRAGSLGNYHQAHENDWMLPLLFLALIGVLIWAFLRKSNNSDSGEKKPESTVPPSKPTRPLYDMNELVKMAHTLGGDLSVNADGSFRISYLTAEEKELLAKNKEKSNAVE